MPGYIRKAIEKRLRAKKYGDGRIYRRCCVERYVSENKIKVPEGMWDAARTMYAQANSLNGRTDCSDADRLMYAIEASLRWLSEPGNYLPTIEQYSSIEDAVYSDHPNGSARLLSYWRQCAMFRKMLERVFVADDPSEPQLDAFDTPFGRVVVDPRVPEGEIRLHSWNGPTLMKNIERASK